MKVANIQNTDLLRLVLRNPYITLALQISSLNSCLYLRDCILFPAVQEERQRNKEKGEGEAESSVNANADMPVEKILEAEIAVEPKTDTYIDAQVSESLRKVSLKYTDQGPIS